jgi:nucleoside-diphosphate-sugar epimerase
MLKYPLVLLGGNSPVGRYLMQRLSSAGLTADVISRRSLDVPEGFTKVKADLHQEGSWSAPANAVVISFLPLWILTEFLPRLGQAKAIIATGSTSRYGKAKSGDARERAMAAKLEQAEEVLQLWAEQNKVTWTILRPTIIYDGKNDQNITRMARFIRRWHFLPLAAPAKGLRQPIHTDDVAKAAFKCLNNPAAANKAFNISGGEVLSYRAMAERIFIALGQNPRFMMLPNSLLQKGLRVVSGLGFFQEAGFVASVFQRMNEDLVFDVAEGMEKLDYQPRTFNPDFSEFL